MVDQTTTSNGFKAFWWIMGIISLLMTAGVVGSITTYAQVGRLDENVSLFREEVLREMERRDDRIRALEDKFDRIILRQDDAGSGR